MRIQLIIYVLLILFHSEAHAQNEKPTVVFVCEHGGARSTIASLYFNKMARENHLPYQSTFFGLTPDSIISEQTKKGLIADGFDVQDLKPRALATNELTSKTLLISLDCRVPASYPLHQAWKGIPAISENYSAARDEIIKHINQLINELKTKNPQH